MPAFSVGPFWSDFKILALSCGSLSTGFVVAGSLLPGAAGFLLDFLRIPPWFPVSVGVETFVEWKLKRQLEPERFGRWYAIRVSVSYMAVCRLALVRTFRHSQQ